MSPAQAMERSYATLKQMLREGVFAPGTRLEAIRLADELGVSMTPVRDVLHRLAGERMVEASSREGFHVPRFTEASLRDLYEWNSALLIMAARTKRSGTEEAPIAPLWEVPAGADRVAALFARIAVAAPNHEIGDAIAAASDRLHPFRIIEQRILERVAGELEQLITRGSNQPHAIRRYHLRRMRAVPDLLRERGEV
ncbi:GntR family transcriptional regulator [Sphingomonas sp. AR_OL41]|uniref:GntR family transcriptional regulator n=1 Tax=Sphingomonas sp. AR_OL41 TaxID=3042729 RepID=UPI002481438A|nr:GntR family transcriptional regulator [Sphingomonas sp. AR_OL41]MDH7972541.1 GntR family transcriptional regulator [Sphingomonas sp. AR_OL41]